MAGAIIAEAALSFLGLGVQPPTPSWGTMLNGGRAHLLDAPHLTVVPPNMAKYKAVSREVFAIFGAGGHAVEGLSMDEAFIAIGDVSLEEATAFARDVRARVLESVGLTVSAGVASGKMIAKIASDFGKPNGLLVVPPGTEREFLAPLPVGRLWGVGPKTLPRIEAAGIATIGDVAALEDERLYAVFGRAGTFFRDLARGIDEREVDGSRERKSISTEVTFEFDVRDEATILDVLRQQADELAEDLKRSSCG